MPDVHVITRNMTSEQLDNLRLSELSDLLNQYSLKKPHTESTKTRCYRVCERFARKFLRVKKPYRNEDEYEGMSITVAEEIYLLILSNKIVTNWIAYANAAYKGWIEIWANLNNISFNKPSININKYYDPNREKPILLEAGMRIKFYSIDEEEFLRISRLEGGDEP